MSTYQLEIDGSGAEAGAERIVKSFDAIKAAADRMEGGVSAAAKKASLLLRNAEERSPRQRGGDQFSQAAQFCIQFVQSSERRCCSQYDYLPAGSQVRRLS
jgi:hypothetical protein